LRTTTYKQKKQKWIQKAKRKAKAAAGKKWVPLHRKYKMMMSFKNQLSKIVIFKIVKTVSMWIFN
jgi:hypothetical protein